MYCRMFSDISDLYLLNASSTHFPSAVTKKVSRHCHKSPQGKITPLVENHSSRDTGFVVVFFSFFNL